MYGNLLHLLTVLPEWGENPMLSLIIVLIENISLLYKFVEYIMKFGDILLCISAVNTSEMRSSTMRASWWNLVTKSPSIRYLQAKESPLASMMIALDFKGGN